MTVDFSRFRADETAPPTRPREIFAALPRRQTEFSYLRDVQGQVMDQWFDRRDERDVSIKMNTGTGKTIVGLLALQSSINETSAPALYVAPDNFLVQQVVDQAEAIGIDYTTNPESSLYLSGKAIGIVNIHRLVNGKSIFGGPGNPRTDPIPIGALVVDDAHACLATIREQSTLRIDRDHEAFAKLFDIFHEGLRAQTPARCADVRDKVRGAVIRVPIPIWYEHLDKVIDLIQDYRSDNSVAFTWPFVADILPICQATFSDTSFEIQPYCPPTNSVLGIQKATRRIYLTATLADDSVLVTHFGTAKSAAERPITPESAADIGDRLILAPREIDPSYTDEDLRNLVADLAKRVNVVVIVPSFRTVEPWEPYTDQVVSADNLAVITEDLRNGHIGLVVLVNKYDGIDLPNDACRVLVLDGLPDPATNSERRDAGILGGSRFLAQKRLQRIEQGMGRGVRSVEDHCVVLLMGVDLSALLANPELKQSLSPATRTQFELSSRIAEELGPRQIADVIQQCLDRDPAWLSLSRESLTGVEYDSGSVDPLAVSQRHAFELASLGQYEKACQVFREGLAAIDDPSVQGWLLEHLATYMQPVNSAETQKVLAAAVLKNRRVLRPLTGIEYRRASASVAQARNARAALVQRFANGRELRLGLESLAARLVFDETKSLDFEDAVEELGFVLGFDSQRPERDVNAGPDALWGMGELRFLVIECKSASIGKVWKKDAGQLATSMNWFRSNYDQTCDCTPVIIHHTGEHAPDAIPDSLTRVIDDACLAKLRDTLRKFGSALTKESSFSSEESVASVLNQHGLNGSNFIDRFSTRPTLT